VALFQFPASPNGQRPSRLPILPGGEVLRGEDGRAWTVGDRMKILARLHAKGVLLVDENHAFNRKAKVGEPSPALCRLSDFALRPDGSIDGAAEWTKYGENAVDGGHYLGLSPVLRYDARRATVDTLGEVVGIDSVSLVNEPNLELPALNDVELGAPQDPEMKPEELTAAINAALKPVIDAQAALSAEVAELKAKPAENSKQDPPAFDETKFALAVNDACERHISNAKLHNTPEARAFFKSQVTDQGKLDAANAYYDAAQSIVPTTAVGLNDKNIPAGPQLTAQQAKLCKDMGWDTKALYPTGA